MSMHGGGYNRAGLDTDPYRMFIFPEMRDDLYAAGQCLSQYAMREEVSAVYFLDRSARPAYIAMKTYWKSQYPAAPLPHIGFLNPKGFVSQEDVRNGTVALPSEPPTDPHKRDKVEPATHIRPHHAIVQEVKKKVKPDDHRGPAVLFDVCIHAGNALRPTFNKLVEAGFDDLRVGVVSTVCNRSDITPDFWVASKELKALCYTFGRDTLTSKAYGSIYAEPNATTANRAKSATIRAEVRRAVQERVNMQG